MPRARVPLKKRVPSRVLEPKQAPAATCEARDLISRHPPSPQRSRNALSLCCKDVFKIQLFQEDRAQGAELVCPVSWARATSGGDD